MKVTMVSSERHEHMDELARLLECSDVKGEIHITYKYRYFPYDDEGRFDEEESFIIGFPGASSINDKRSIAVFDCYKCHLDFLCENSFIRDIYYADIWNMVEAAESIVRVVKERNQ